MSEAPSPWQTYRRLVGFARPYRLLLAVALVGMLIEAAAAAGFTALMKPVVDETFIKRNDAVVVWLPLAIGLPILAASWLHTYWEAPALRWGRTLAKRVAAGERAADTSRLAAE